MKKLIIIAIAVISILIFNNQTAHSDISNGSGKIKFELKNKSFWYLCLAGEGNCNFTIEIEIPIPIGNPPKLSLGPGQIPFVFKALNNEFSEATPGQLILFNELTIAPNNPDIVEGTTDATLYIPTQQIQDDVELGGFLGFLYLQ